MDSFDIVNMYYNFIFNGGPISYHRVFESFETIQSFKKWLDDHQIYLSFIQQVQHGVYDLFVRAKDYEKYDVAFKTNYKETYESYIEQEKQKYQVLFLSGKQPVSSQFHIERINNDLMRVLVIDDIIEDDLSIYGPYSLFLNALYQIENWPGVLVFKGDQWNFYALKTQEDVDHVYEMIKEGTVFDHIEIDENNYYFVHLSDLHLGTKETDYGVTVLNDSLDELCSHLNCSNQIKFLVTGDLMNSPNRKNMYAASSFMTRLKKQYDGDVTFVLGNHDVIVHGLNLLKRQKTKVVAYLLGEDIKVYHDLKMIVIKLDSTSEGNLARGKVGKNRLMEIDDELSSIRHSEDYTRIAILHHHLMPLRKDEFLKTKWNEKLFMGKIADSTKALLDANDVMKWLKDHDVHYVFHGHKHIPCVVKKEDTYIMAAGTACGGFTKESKSRYLSYNLLKFDAKEKRFKYCFVFYDDTTKQERHRVKVTLFKEEKE